MLVWSPKSRVLRASLHGYMTEMFELQVYLLTAALKSFGSEPAVAICDIKVQPSEKKTLMNHESSMLTKKTIWRGAQRYVVNHLAWVARQLSLWRQISTANWEHLKYKFVSSSAWLILFIVSLYTHAPTWSITKATKKFWALEEQSHSLRITYLNHIYRRRKYLENQNSIPYHQRIVILYF